MKSLRNAGKTLDLVTSHIEDDYDYDSKELYN